MTSLYMNADYPSLGKLDISENELSVFVLAKANNFGGRSAYVNANYGSVHPKNRPFQTFLNLL